MRQLLVTLLMALPLVASAQTNQAIFLKCAVSGWQTSGKWDRGNYIEGPRYKIDEIKIFKVNERDRLITQYSSQDKQFFEPDLCSIEIKNRVTTCIFNERLIKWERIGGYSANDKESEHIGLSIDRKTGQIHEFGQFNRPKIDQNDYQDDGTCELTADPTVDNRPNKF